MKRDTVSRRVVSLAVSAMALALVATLAGEAEAQRPGLVTLELPVGSRAVGMGSAFVSVVDDATAMHWNPAGLSRLGVADRHFEILFQHNEWIADFRQEYIGGATRIGNHALGGSFTGVYISDIDGRDEFAQPTLTFGAYDIAVTGSYAYTLTDRVSLGGSIKYIVSNIDDLTRFAFAGDVGAQVEVVPDLRVGGTVSNLGRGLVFLRERDDLPTAVQVGGSYRIPRYVGPGNVMFAVDVRKSRGDDAHVLFGGEYDYAGVAQVRLGYRSGYDDKGINFGAGAVVAGWTLGYAAVPFNSPLGTTHYLSFSFRI